MHRPGVTLAELLIVLAILGILLALGLPNYLRWRDSSALRQAQTDISVALDRARTTAKRTNATRTVSWTSTSIGGQTLGNGVTISAATMTVGGATSAATSLSYRPPYGTLVEVGGTVPTYTLTISKGQRSGTVRVSGVFGKALATAINY